MSKELSIIIPIYNGEAYIDRLINSILIQEGIELDTLEVLLINDGSKDESLLKIKDYERKHPTIINVVDQPNLGAATTRNKGILLSKGKYLTLIDQDDLIDSTYCATLVSAIKKGNYDVVQSGFKLTNEEGHVKKIILPSDTEFGKFLAIPAWAKIYRAQFLKDNNITFFENNIGEDTVFTTRVIQSTSLYKTIQYAGYNNLYDNKNNVTNSLHKGLSQSVDMIKLLDELNKIKQEYPDNQKLLEYNIIRTSVYYLLVYGRYATTNRFVDEYKKEFKWMHAHLLSTFGNKYVWKKPNGEYISASTTIKLLLLMDALHIVPLFAKFYCKGKES